jgi:hypothetical protein
MHLIMFSTFHRLNCTFAELRMEHLIVRKYLLWLDSNCRSRTISTQKYHNSQAAGHVQLLCKNSIPSIPPQFAEVSGGGIWIRHPQGVGRQE